jgi:TonB family protein
LDARPLSWVPIVPAASRFENFNKHPKFSNFGALPTVATPDNLKLVRGLHVMRKRYILVAAAIVSLASLVTMQGASAQINSERKVASRVAPVYPELAKKMHIRGVVKLEAIVRPNGTVRSTRALGGNPVLVEAAIDAVGKWKFDPAPGETTEVLQLSFESQ